MMLCCIISCCTVSYHAVLYCIVLYCIILYHVISTSLCFTISYRAVLLYFIVLCVMLYCIVLCCIALRCVGLYCIFIVLYCIALHYIVNEIAPKRKKVNNNSSANTWHENFQTVLTPDHFVHEDTNDAPLDPIVEDDEEDMRIINYPSTREEVVKTTKGLRNGKTLGPDGILGDFLKTAADTVTDLVMLFTKLFDRGIYRNNWTNSVIQPLHKKGDPNNPNNYRGISLSDISGKLYSTVINRRLQLWIEMKDSVGEHQAGFRKDYSTIDHIFTLLAIIQKQLSLKRKLYVAFIDFEKAFDSISRKLLWPILRKNGIRGKLFSCVKSMYANVKARVRDGALLTECIECIRGVKQGDVCSPVLFSLFINELAAEIINGGKHGSLLTPSLVELFIMLSAYDILCGACPLCQVPRLS